jgi:hypothetical protein
LAGAMFGMVENRIFKKIDEVVKNIIKIEKVFQPDLRHINYYHYKYEIFKEIYKSNVGNIKSLYKLSEKY